MCHYSYFAIFGLQTLHLVRSNALSLQSACDRPRKEEEERRRKEKEGEERRRKKKEGEGRHGVRHSCRTKIDRIHTGKVGQSHRKFACTLGLVDGARQKHLSCTSLTSDLHAAFERFRRFPRVFLVQVCDLKRIAIQAKATKKERMFAITRLSLRKRKLKLTRTANTNSNHTVRLRSICIRSTTGRL